MPVNARRNPKSAKRATAPARPCSEADWTRARRLLVGGVNSPVRAFRRVGQEPLMLAQGRGASVRDVQGRAFVDFIMGWGALILGHAHPRVMEAVARQLRGGTALGLTGPGEVELAQAIVDAVPSVEQVRFTASGTEASMTAIRLARAATSRSRVLSFEGCYHGHSDGLLVKRGSGLATLGLSGSAGVPGPIAQETLVVPYNNPGALEQAIAEYGDTIACAILEPIAANMGVVAPDRAFLERLRAVTSERGIVLIFDEVVTGFRVGFGGAQGFFGIRPDLTILGKIIGGGFPIGAVGGAERLMRRLAPEGDVYHAGTFAGHPTAMAAGIATLRALREEPPYGALDALGERLADGLARWAQRAGAPARINRVGSMLTIFFADAAVRDFDSAQSSDLARFAAFAKRLREAGVLIPPSQFETLFISTAHTPRLIDRALAALEPRDA